MIWTLLKRLKRENSPLFDDFPLNLLFDRHLPSNFDHKIFCESLHIYCILSSSLSISYKKALDFLDRHGVKYHPKKLKQKYGQWLQAVSSGRRYVSESTSWQCSCHKIDGYDVLLIVLVLWYIPGAHPWVDVVSPGLAKHYLCATHDMKVTTGGKNELKQIESLFHLL